MKTASFIFILIGMVTNFFTIGTWAVIGVVVGLLAMTFLAEDNKNILAWTPPVNNEKRENKK